MHLILTTTKITFQNGINQPCRGNNVWYIDDYVAKLEKRSCIVLPLRHIQSKDTYAPKMADYGPIFISFECFNGFHMNLTLKIKIDRKFDKLKYCKKTNYRNWNVVGEYNIGATNWCYCQFSNIAKSKKCTEVIKRKTVIKEALHEKT